MRIAFVSNFIEPTGGDHILYNHVVGLRKLGHIVDPYFTGWHDSYKNSVKNWNSDTSANPIFYEYNQLHKIDFSGYDLAVANGLYGADQLRTTNAQNKVWFCQNFDPYIFGKSKEIDKVYEYYDNYLLYSKDLKTIIKHYYGNKNFVVCNNGIEYEKFLPYQKKKDEVKSRRICFIVAYYRNYKGIKFANDIFAELKKRGFTTVEINVVGGPLKSTMEYHQNPSFEDKCRILASCDFSIHPSVFETWNLTSMESMALGVPVVGVNSKGIMEYVNNRNSMIFENRDANQICDAIDNLYNAVTYRDLQENGISTAKAHDWDFIMSQIEKAYIKFIDPIEKEYSLACNGKIAEDIQEHIPTLRRYAEMCNDIVELGVRTGASTRAFLSAKPKSLLSVDIIPMPLEVSRLKSLVKDTKWAYIESDDLKIEVPEIDMLFIDTYHTYDQLIQELKLHGNKAKKFIVLHDTTTWGEQGHGGVKGLMYAVKEFLSLNSCWVIREEFKNNNGLLILERNNV